MSIKISDKERLEHHYKYELFMLSRTYSASQRKHDIVIENALIESFCVHARELIEFFRKEGNYYTDISCNPFHKVKGKVEKLNIKLNHAAFHLVRAQRTANQAEKVTLNDRDQLINLISIETHEFRNNIKENFRLLDIPVLPVIGRQGVRVPEDDYRPATGATGSVGP